jgi:glycogen operon protein
VPERGTYEGLRRLLPYLVELGVTTIELLPVHQGDPQEGSYWGYMPLAFGAVHSGYAATDDPAAELAHLVRDAHERGLEVMVDVVLNHTTELGGDGPTYSLRGVANRSYYIVDGAGWFRNDSGCGNTIRSADPGTARLLLWSLERLADLGIDGFRFDLAAVLARDVDGHLGPRSDVIDQITELAGRRGLHLVAEPWDMSAYLLGSAFPGRTWAQWNDRFRDTVRSFVRGEPGLVHDLQLRVAGSPDIFDGEPHRSINFVTAHDGFTLHDLVAFDHKHNEANGHGGADGSDANLSWNCGWEGEVGAPDEVLTLRARQMRNALCLLLLSNGTPMLLGGDEMARTQLGNNNAYNQDNEISWFDWERGRRYADLTRFTKLLIGFRRAHPSIGRPALWGDDVTFFGVSGRPDLGPDSRSLAWFLSGASVGDDDIYVMVNAWWEPLRFHVQVDGPWWRVVDTAAPSPNDILEPESWHPVLTSVYEVAPRSTVVLLRRAAERPSDQR